MSDEDEDDNSGDNKYARAMMTESQRRLKQLKVLKSSFALAKNVKLENFLASKE